MIPTSRDVTAILLAGGRSTRFGEDKGRIVSGGRTLLEHAAAALPAGRAATIVVVRPEQLAAYAGLLSDATVVPDDADLPEGPLRGVVTGLRSCRTAWAWVVACDQPVVRPALLAAFLEVADDRPVIPVWNDRPQPLVALYPAAYAEDLAAFALSGVRSLTGAVDRAGYLEFAADACRAVDPDGRSFLNVNTPAQLEEIEALPKEDP
jgi:molybdopterin-guanine dinucleotide biosynthesis protein A